MMRFLHTLYIILFAAVSLHLNARELTFDRCEAATVGVQITEIATGKSLATENICQAMTPASILKCVTSAAALTALGDDYRFTTDVYATGPVTADGTLDGNIVICASGDPTIESGRYGGAESFVAPLIAAIREAGIRRIAGDVYIDDGNMSDQGQSPQWLIEDTAWDYGAGYYAFNYTGNTYRLNLTTMATNPAVEAPEVVTRVTDSGTDMLRGMDSDLLYVTGRKVRTNGFCITTSMDSPSDAALIAIADALSAAGIEVAADESKTEMTRRTLIYSHRSPDAATILADMMRRSDNLIAEAMLRALAPMQSRDKALSAEHAILSSAGISTSATRIVDGSGLARTDRVTPQFMTDLLTWMARSDNSARYVSFFPKVGLEGTVKRLLKGTRLEGKLCLKSGSMNGVHCYAGYRLDADGTPTHTVVIMVNNFFCSRDAVRNAISSLLLEKF